MKFQNAIKKVEKNLNKEMTIDGSKATIIEGNKEMSFLKNGGEEGSAICIRIRSLSDVDDIMTDYCAGVFYDNIGQGLRSMNNQ